MTREEALVALRALADDDDPEMSHQEADTILLDLINDEEIRDAFRNVHRWYS